MTTLPGIFGQLQSQRTGIRVDWRNIHGAAVLLLVLAGLGCGDTFRPVALPIPLPSPTPAPTHFVASLSSNGDNVLNSTGTSCSPSGTLPPCIEDPGAISRIDVSGDSIASIATTGPAPVHAAFLPSGSKIYVANSGEDTVSSIATTTPTAATTISLPQLCVPPVVCPSVPVFVTSTENGKMYVANSGNGTVSVIDTTSDVVVNTVTIPILPGSLPPDPIALAELPNGFKLYSVNQGNKTVTSISTVDDTVLTNISINVPPSFSPIWAVASSDSTEVYVLDTSGTISVIDTLSDTVVNNSISVSAGANFMLFDSVANRLYVTNPALGTVSIFDVAGSVLTAHAGSPIAITAAVGSGCSSLPKPSSVTVLGDGNRAYVASFQADPSGAVCTQATVINTLAGTVSSVIPLSESTDMSSQTGCSSARFRVFAATSGGGANSNFKVYVSQCDAGSVAVIDTFSSSTGTNQHPADVLGATLSAPLSGFAPPVGQVDPPFQNPVFVVAGP